MNTAGQPFFDQRGWQVDKVYNVAGDLHEGSSATDLVAALRQLREALRAMPEVAPAERVAIESDLTEALEAADRPRADGDQVVGALGRLRDRLRLLGLAAGEGLTLARSVGDIITWVQGHL